MSEVMDDRGGDRRLNSWKEIAAFFGKDERTVKRWEVSRGLPVRRVPGGTGTSVFAYAGELENWLTGGTGRPADPPPVPIRTTAGPAAVARKPQWPRYASLAVATVVLGVVASLAVPNIWDRAGAVRQEMAHTPPAEAQELYLSGVYDWNTRTGEGLNRAVASLERAVTLDPEFAKAYAELANAYNLLSQYTLTPAAAAYPKARAAAERALELEPDLPEALAALAFNEFYWERNIVRSAELFERAVALEPNSAQVLHWYALTSMHLGRFERPVELITRALELKPDSRAIRANKALIYFHAGRVEEALTMLTELQQDNPDFLATPSYLATIYLDQRRYPEFLRAYEEAATVENNAARLAIAAVAQRGFEDGGGTGMLRAMLSEQQRQFEAGDEPAYKLATTAALLGDGAAAVDYLRQSFERNEPDRYGMRIDPAFRTLHADTGYRELLQRAGLPLPD